jgi:multidrug efflux pump subunit AcrB
VAQVEKIVAQYKDIEYVIANVGAVGGNPFGQGGVGTHINRVVMDFKDFHDRSRPSSGIIEEVRKRVTSLIRGAEVQVREEEHGPPTGAPFNLELYGPDIERLGELSHEMKKNVENIRGLVDLRDDYVEGRPELRIRIDKEKAALLGLDTLTIAYIVKAAVNGVKVGTFRQGQDEYDIVARLPEKDRQSIESLKRLTISGPRGEPIPLTSVAVVTMTSGLGSINRRNQQRVVTVEGDASGRLANDIIQEAKEQRKSQVFLTKAFIAAIFIIFFILVSEFNSIVTPFIILTSVLLSFIGVFLGLVITGRPFSITMTGVGVVALTGVVVKNAIVLIDFYNQQLARGMSVYEALVRTGALRFRPVMLTAITTILGLLPTAVGVSIDFRHFKLLIGGESVEMWSSMATVVIFGLTVATLLTLVVVPVLCSLAAGKKGRVKVRETV